ncbi:CubicO group peptidase (beta-lactamase class C family) [Streptacidiphilus sp. MAP12-33]|uniref:serine hydrolase domain-containing protein n=1 Tax=Streptacidiphilus sp. MAP12-33 TaxID=3156266 RepID=UPI003514697C
MPTPDWDRLTGVLSEHVAAGAVPGAVLAVSRGKETRVAAVGARAMDGDVPLSGDEVFRISSMTKPLTAALTLMLAEEGALSLEAPIERWVPELARRRVLRLLDGPIEDTVAAERPITVDDLLTMRMGFGFVLDSPCPALERAAELGLGIGPPDPSVSLTPDAWVTRFAELPLLHQPGADWMYELGFAVLGVVLARAGGQALDDLFRDRLLDPLGMTDTGFGVPARARTRLVPCYASGGNGLELFDSADATSRWNHRPSFPDARGGLVSTASDYLRFARMLLSGGTHDGTPLMAEQSVAAMTADHLGADRDRSVSARAFLSAGAGWGYGLEVFTTGVAPAPSMRTTRYGWGGGLGTTWYSFPDLDTAAVLLTQCLPPPEPLVTAFWSELTALIGA